MLFSTGGLPDILSPMLYAIHPIVGAIVSSAGIITLDEASKCSDGRYS